MVLKGLGITYRQLRVFGGWPETSRVNPLLTNKEYAQSAPDGKSLERSFALRSMSARSHSVSLPQVESTTALLHHVRPDLRRPAQDLSQADSRLGARQEKDRARFRVR